MRSQAEPGKRGGNSLNLRIELELCYTFKVHDIVLNRIVGRAVKERREQESQRGELSLRPIDGDVDQEVLRR